MDRSRTLVLFVLLGPLAACASAPPQPVETRASSIDNIQPTPPRQDECELAYLNWVLKGHQTQATVPVDNVGDEEDHEAAKKEFIAACQTDWYKQKPNRPASPLPH